MAGGIHLRRGLSMRDGHAPVWALVLLVLAAPPLALSGAAEAEPKGAPAVAGPPEDREIPPDRGRIYMLDEDFALCIKRLRSPRTPMEKRIEAVGAFALTKDHRVVPLFDRIARDEAQPIALRVAVLWALGEIGDPRGLPTLQFALSQMLLKSDAWEYDQGVHVELDGQVRTISLREMVTGELARLAEPLVGKYAEFLLQPVLGGITQGDDPKADKRRAALVTLAAVGDRDGRAVRALCTVLRAEDKFYPWDFKIVAARALSDLVERRRKAFAAMHADDKLLPEIGKAFIEGAVVTDEPEVREIAGWSLRRMGWADRAGRELAFFLENPLPKQARFRIIEALASIRSKEAAEAIILQLADPDPNVRWRACIALGATGHKDPAIAVRFLARLTANPPEADPKVRLKACAGLGHLEDPRAIPRLAVAMDDPEPMVRVQAAIALGRIGKEAAIPALVGRGLKDPSVRVRGMSVVALGNLKREEGLKPIARLLADPEARDESAAVRLVAVRVLDPFLNATASKALLAALGDPDGKVRDAATKAIKSRLTAKPELFLPALAKVVAKDTGPSRVGALQCIVEDYRSSLADAKRKALYDKLLADADSPLAAALLETLEDKKADGETRTLAAGFLIDLAWRREPKGKAILTRVAALTRDIEPGVRAAARRAKNYLNNLR